MGTKPSEVQILFHRRTARSRGATSSNAQNDMMDEISHDLLEISTQINDSIIPALSTLGNGTFEEEVDAFSNGIDGRSIYANSTATTENDIAFFNVIAERPYTIYEELNNLYTTISGVNSDLEDQISGFIKAASDVTIEDVGGLYIATNVEAALTEVMEKINLVALGQIDLTAVHDHYIPVTTDTFDLGTSAVALRSVYPNTIYFKPSATAPTVAEGALWYDSVAHVLKVYNGTMWKTVSTT